MGQMATCRVLLDSGSEINFITKEMLNFLGIKPKATASTIKGIGGLKTLINESAEVTIHSRINTYKATLKFLVLSKITEN
jgi:Putative peptidase (DUF1758)